MDTLRRELRALKLSLTRQKTQIEDLCKKKSMDIESLSKLESLMSMYFNPLSAKIEDVINQILKQLDPDDAEQKKSKIDFLQI